jgi:hypothetical protein
MRCCFSLFLLITLLPSWAAASSPHIDKVSLDFIYVNANEGEAAGGHTALRLGNTVFHYQFFPDSSFLLVREPWVSFCFLYNELHNRTISIASLPLEPADFQQIRNHFTEILITQQEFFTSFEKLQEDLELLRIFQAGKGRITIPNLGFFVHSSNTLSVSTTSLQTEIKTKLGSGFLRQAAEKAEQTLNTGRNDPPAKETLLETLVWYKAVRILENGSCLNPETVIPPMPEEKPLTPAEQQRLQQFNLKQQQSILNLLQSTRPDRGQALLLQTARYLVVQQSLEKNYLYTLDPFPDQAKTAKVNTEKHKQEELSLARQRMLRQAVKRSHLFFSEKTHTEVAYSLLETGRARAWELQQAEKGKPEIRLLPETQLPSHSKKITVQNLHNNLNLNKQITCLSNKLQQMQKIKKTRYGYNLFFQNCATELIRSLNTSFPDQKTGQTILRGWLEPNSGFVFVPFLFYDKSLTAFPLQDEQIVTARRLRHLEKLYAEENDFLVWLRESNTLSSTLYEPRRRDTPFLFFTDDSLFLRPFQGICNFGYAALHSIAGIFTLPFDGGEHLHQAGRGMFYSLPEITFNNIRKGSYTTARYLQ